MASNQFIKLEYGFIDSNLAKFEPTEFMVWICLKRHENMKTHISFPSESRIMQETGIKSRTTVIKAIQRLENIKAITIEPTKRKFGGFYNVYKMLV